MYICQLERKLKKSKMKKKNLQKKLSQYKLIYIWLFDFFEKTRNPSKNLITAKTNWWEFLNFSFFLPLKKFGTLLH